LLTANVKVGELTPRQRRFVEIIQSNANRLTELVNDILEISRIETGRIKLEFASLDITEVIREVALSFEGQMVKKLMNLTFHLPKNLPLVYADRARLTQVLVNLIGNAWQYTPEGGRIDVSAKALEGFVQVDVADTGIGIVEKDIEYVFDRFFRSERTEVQVVDGTGLGLSITKSFVEMLGGQIWLESQIDVGTTFSFTLPVDPNKIDIPLVESGPSARPQLLLVNHHEDVVKLLMPGLERRGYQVTPITGEKGALKFARSSGRMLRFILADVSTQDSDLFEFFSQLAGEKNEIDPPLVMISSLSATQSGLVLHLIDCISTSFENALIVKKVSSALNIIKEWGLQTKPLPVNRPGPILIVEQDRGVSNWLKDILTSSGYGVQCAFNSQQALDMAFGDRPSLILVNAQMPGVDTNSLISEFRQSSYTRSVPLMLVTDKSIPTEEAKEIKIFGRETWRKGGQSVSVEALVAELPQVETVLS
jgi:DNA-binding response OmpR family regulator